MYGEFFDVPPPQELVFLSWFPGGEVFARAVVTRGIRKDLLLPTRSLELSDVLQRRCAEDHRQCRALGHASRRTGAGIWQSGASTGREIAATGEVGSRT